jgi:hypothetical protein
MKETAMNAYQDPRAFDALPETNDNNQGIMPQELARALAKVEPWLAHPPEMLRPDPLQRREWPQEAVAPFNQTIISNRVAGIGTALAGHYIGQPVMRDVEQARFHALLRRHALQPLTGDALQIAKALHAYAVEQPLGRDPVGLDDYIDMRPHMFTRHQQRLAEHILHWAEHGVEPGAFHEDGPAR